MSCRRADAGRSSPPRSRRRRSRESWRHVRDRVRMPCRERRHSHRVPPALDVRRRRSRSPADYIQCTHRAASAAPRHRRSRAVYASIPVVIRRTLLVALASCWALWACAPVDATPRQHNLRGTVLPEPVPKADFTLPDTDGDPFDFRSRTDGKLTLLFFGYTHCPDVCPVHLANIASALQRLSFEERERVSVVFVSTDPDRDTPQRIREWLDSFDRSFRRPRG